ncbi:MAG: opioid growth factor receptor-related protein [Candidatus Eremiobacteraeota bacterium]|nr:opioid growth factor receptor-related protein [Candidatus Eremiobacteraeota bacterium]
MTRFRGADIVRFYEGTAPDSEGRYIEQILRFDDRALERTHDYIQWLFPTPQRSAFNPDAPPLDDSAIAEFRARPELQTALRRSLNRMLGFYGLEWDGGAIRRGTSFGNHDGWLQVGDHNHLRLTRILNSLRTLGDEEAARELFRCLATIYDDERRRGRTAISETTYCFWRDAAG